MNKIKTLKTKMIKNKRQYLNNKRYLNAYMTIEASLIIPLVIGIYFLLIFTSFYLYTKCVLTQNTYIRCYRAGIFTYWEDGYGEVSYHDLARRNASEAKEYLKSRNDFSKYPFFDLLDEQIIVTQLTVEIYVDISLSGTSKSFLRNDYQQKINAVSQITNPVSNIRAARRAEKNAGN
ncbi:MAG: pilus assembly protein [Lachnospiraceae bacterium]|nr:pilus assembly protein [Lachnospiraceae bacterium]